MQIRHEKLNLCKACLMRYRQEQAPKIYCADGCGELIPNIDSDGKPRKYLKGHKKRIKSRGLPKGKKLNPNGYILVFKPNHPFSNLDGYVLEHRLVYEEYHNVCLLPWTDIHHKNKNIKDNKIENLQAMSKSQHQSITHIKDTSDRYCSDCGSNETYINEKNIKVWSEIYENIWLCQNCYARYYYWLKKKLIENSSINVLHS